MRVWPTVMASTNRKSRKAMTSSAANGGNGRRSGGGNSSPPGLEQVVELEAGITPKEMWPTPTESDGDSSARHSTSAEAMHEGTTLTDAVRLWPTPTASTGGDGERADGYRRLLAPEVHRQEAWPTPTVQDSKNNAGPSEWRRNSDPLNVSVERWATPKASPSGPDYARAGRPESGADDLATQVAKTGARNQLNPEWVETLMGYPIGWTDIGGPLRRARSTNGSRPGRSRRSRAESPASAASGTP